MEKSDVELESVMKLKLLRRLFPSFWLGHFILGKTLSFLNILIWSNKAQLQIKWGRAEASKPKHWLTPEYPESLLWGFLNNDEL